MAGDTIKKNITFIIILILLISLIQINPVISDTFDPQTDWIIDGDKVYVNDSKAYLSAEPHTITKEGWVIFEAMRKTGPEQMDIDFCWGFNSTLARPTKPQYWNGTDWLYVSSELFTHVEYIYENMTNWYLIKNFPSTKNISYKARAWIKLPSGVEDDISEKYWWCSKPSSQTIQEAISAETFYTLDPWYYPWNSWIIEGDRVYINNSDVYLSAEPHTIYENSWVIFEAMRKTGPEQMDIDFCWGFNGSEAQPTNPQRWNGINWVNISGDKFIHIDYTHQNMTDWHIIKDFTTNKDQLYKARAWVEFYGGAGKYWWCSKPSSQTIQEAISAGTFYKLDPWYTPIIAWYDSFEDGHTQTDPFDTNPSAYWNDGGGEEVWFYANNYTSSSSTGCGISSDRLGYEGEWVAYTEASYDVLDDAPADYLLESDAFNLSYGDNLTLDFWYHMYGLNTDFDYCAVQINYSGDWDDLWNLTSVSHTGYASSDFWDHGFAYAENGANAPYIGSHKLRFKVWLLQDSKGDFCLDAVWLNVTRLGGNLSISNENPVNQSTGISRQPTINVTIIDDNGDNSICDFYTSIDGNNWTHRQQNISVLNESISYIYIQASNYSTKYYWKVTANNTVDNISAIYWFITEEPPPPTPSDFNYYKKIVIDHNKISETLYNFPYLVHNISSDFANHAQSDGDDFAFYSEDNNTQYNHEIEYYNSTSGEFIVWVNVTTVSSIQDTIIYLYYGNSTCSSQENITGVWDSNYVLIQHLNETDIDGGSGDIKDSTSYGNHGTTGSMTTSDQVQGKIDGSFDFDGDNNYVNCGDDSSLGFTSEITLEAWIRWGGDCDAVDDLQNILCNGYWARNIRVTESDHYMYGGSRLLNQFEIGGSEERVYSTIQLTPGMWYYVVSTYNGSALQLYMNGSYDNSTPASGAIHSTSSDTIIGVEDSFTYYFNGTIDEIRISDIARNSSWINASYTNQYDPENFSSIGNEIETEAELNISVTPNNINFGVVSVGANNKTTNYYFNLTNHGTTCNVEINISNSQNWTFVNYSDIGHDTFAMNWSGDNWSSESNIKVGGSTLKSNLIASDYYPFDLKILTPTTISKIGNGESIIITLTATAV